MTNTSFRTGQIIPLRYKDREFKALIIDPNGLGPNKPTIGMGFRGMDRHIGIPRQTLQNRVAQIEGGKQLKLPSGNTFRVAQILGEDNNDYLIIEASDWVSLAMDWAKNPGKLRKPTRDSIIDFLGWFASEGIYAQAYTMLKKVYTDQDSQTIHQWLMSREAGKPPRKDWSWEVREKDPKQRYALLTNYIYRELFGMDASQMKVIWQNPVSGSRQIARNYIPEKEGLEAIAYCEKLISQLGLDDIEQAHDIAIQATRVKFKQFFAED